MEFLDHIKRGVLRSNFRKRIFKSKTDKRGGGLEKNEFNDTIKKNFPNFPNHIKRADFFGYIIKGTGTAKRILRSSLRSRGQDSSGSALGACKVI